jgi:hypothetical protein
MESMAGDYVSSIKTIKVIFEPGTNESIPKNLSYFPTTSGNNFL